ncbi:MAG: hypothetical protein U1E29_12485 [Coriobacteriia bacterium]|nr:hypothetical protein [Coriobacteriia bacterium]
MEFLLAMFGLQVTVVVTVLAIASLLFPVFWLWMLVDSILRESWEYPSAGNNEKIVWVLLTALVQPVAVLYYLLVYRKVRRGAVVRPASPSPS